MADKTADPKPTEPTAKVSTAKASPLCDCTNIHHERGVPGCTHAPGGDGRPMAIDPATGELAVDADGKHFVDVEAEKRAAKKHKHPPA